MQVLKMRQTRVAQSTYRVTYWHCPRKG